MARTTEDKPNRKTIPKAVKITVWNKYIGSDKARGKCYCCGRVIYNTDFDVGHNIAHSKGGKDTVDNLRPICRTCNGSMGTTSIETFKARHFGSTISNTQKEADDYATLDIKARKWVSTLGYQRIPEKTGFDIYAKKEAFLEPTQHIVVDYCQKPMTAIYISKFLDKTAKFYRQLADTTVWGSPALTCFIAYSGELPASATSLVRSIKPQVKFKKF